MMEVKGSFERERERRSLPGQAGFVLPHRVYMDLE